jgi:serine/threonine protein kinase
VRDATEGLGLLHAIDAYHCDFSPENLMLDKDMGVKVKLPDFGACSSLGGSLSMGIPAEKFTLPRDDDVSPDVHTDVFSLGSTIDEIMTSRIPYGNLEREEAARLYQLGQFPDVEGVPLAAVIRRCWLLDVVSTKEVLDMLPLEMKPSN